jgi:hypothetical protein
MISTALTAIDQEKDLDQLSEVLRAIDVAISEDTEELLTQRVQE